MKGKLLLVTGVAVGYVLGTRAGRERYEQIKRRAVELWNDPHVQRTVDDVEDAVGTATAEVQERLADATTKVVGAVTSFGRRDDERRDDKRHDDKRRDDETWTDLDREARAAMPPD